MAFLVDVFGFKLRASFCAMLPDQLFVRSLSDYSLQRSVNICQMAASVWWKEKDSFDDEGIIVFLNFTAIFSVSNDINRIRMQPWNLCISTQFFILFI